MRNSILISPARIIRLVFVLILFISIKATAQSIPVNFYKPKIDFTTGVIPFSVTISDVDGDGKSDMIIINSASNSISVFRNTSISGSISASSFAAKVDFATGANPVSVAIDDVDGDSKPDLVIANRSSDNISVLRNTSTPGSISSSSFAAKVDFSAGAGPLSVVVGDVDGDSKPDLVVANYNSNSISVFHNTSIPGSISASSFATKIDFATAAEPSIVAIGNIDGDSKPDLAVTNFASNTVSIFRNTSTSGTINSSSFGAKVDFTTAANPYFVSIGDIDGDDKSELVVTNVSSVSVSVFHNISTSGINTSSFAAKVDFTVGFHPVTVAIGDLDGDGKADMVVANQLSDNISVLHNTSTTGNISASSFATKTDFATGNQPVSVATGDLDGDGIPEIAATNYNSNTVSVFQITAPLSTSHSWQWAKRPDIELAAYTNPSVSADGNGNTYVTGAFVGTATFATMPSPTILISAGEADIFIAKYDASGNVLWAKRAGSAHSDAAYSIKYDGFGNLYVAGYFVESTNFDGTIIINPASNSSNVFLAKYEATTGNFLWVRHGAGVDGYTRQAFDVAVDKYGDPYITGEICNTTTFAPLPTLTLSNRWWDIFVVKYNSAGVAQWQTTVGSIDAGYNGEGGTGIAVD
ncbi:MAG TPA: VCBS repeat-containing protein, partial [Chitinophagaceae bacterium]|nr:VCBS repeat-containing protein [Chitinophagaceae bacterium]